MSAPDPGRLDNITTHPSILADLDRFVIRYGKAMRRYMGAMIRDSHDADDVAQSLLVQIIRSGLARQAPEKGRFRDYLKAVVRNVARTHLGKRRPEQFGDAAADLPAESPDSEAERQWLADWRAAVLESGWTALELHQEGREDFHGYWALRLTADHPDESSQQLADRLAAKVGRPVRADAYRKQLSRARRLFAAFLWQEVAGTLANVSPPEVAEELVTLGLMPYLRDYLPASLGGRQPGT